jgi:two-component system sensor histidine kinase DegS
MTTASELAAQFAAEAAQLDGELAEIDMLVNQATTEATRHEARRAAAAERLAGAGGGADGKEIHDLAMQVTTLTRRAALMEAQLEILQGKRHSIVRLREVIDAHAAALGSVTGESGSGGAAVDETGETVIPPAISRIVLSAQEDLRREIARAMHDGPAQSLTNIVLQAEIAERLVGKDPEMAAAEVRQLVAMVQQTLEATKTFIFNVRPMVLDDLGLVPTLRRATRDRGRTAGIAVDFSSAGVDRRLPVELESGIFRIMDEALAAYLALKPERVSVGLDWGEALMVTIRASRTPVAIPALDAPERGADTPPALAAMMDERREAHQERVEAARRDANVKLPGRLVRELQDRAATLSIAAEISDDGEVRLRAELPPEGTEGSPTPA